jgi:hypothetical protein
MGKLLALAVFCACLPAAWPAQVYYLAFCVTQGHAYVAFIDGNTGKNYGRGFWAADYAKRNNLQKAAPVPNAGEQPSGDAGSEVTNTDPPSSSAEGVAAVGKAEGFHIDTEEIQAVLGVPGIVAADSTGGKGKCMYFQVTKGEYDGAANFVNKFGDQEYSALGMNCLKFAKKVFEEGARIDLEVYCWVGGGSMFGAANSPNPKFWYDCINGYLQDEHGRRVIQSLRLHLSSPGSGTKHSAVVAYTDERDVLAAYGIPATKGQAPSGDARLTAETKAHENTFLHPEITYAAMASLGRAPVVTAIRPAVEATAACGADCSEVLINSPLTLRPDPPPNSEFLTWWEWGDGTTTNYYVDPSHAYTRQGSYLVTMRGFDQTGTRRVGWYSVKVYATLPREEPTGEAKVVTETAGGLTEVTFDTVHGRVYVRLPDDAAPGDTISGTVRIEAQGKTAQEKAANEESLKKLTISAARQKRPAFFDWVKWSVPAVEGSLAVALMREDGRPLASTLVPVHPATTTPTGEYGVPPLMQTGKPVSITGPFDGDRSSITVTAGGQEAKVLAESPRKVVVEAPKTAMGPVQVEIRQGHANPVRKPARLAGVHLEAGKYDLLKGERTELTAKVEGLRGLQQPVELRLKVTTPGVIQMQGGAEQRLVIQPKDVAPDGTCTFRRILTGITPGGFGITSGLSSMK